MKEKKLLQIIGLPIHVWNMNSFVNVGKVWGELLEVYSKVETFEHAYILISTTRREVKTGSVVIRNGHHEYEILVREVDKVEEGWVPSMEVDKEVKDRLVVEATNSPEASPIITTRAAPWVGEDLREEDTQGLDQVDQSSENNVIDEVSDDRVEEQVSNSKRIHDLDAIFNEIDELDKTQESDNEDNDSILHILENKSDSETEDDNETPIENDHPNEDTIEAMNEENSCVHVIVPETQQPRDESEQVFSEESQLKDSQIMTPQMRKRGRPRKSDKDQGMTEENKQQDEAEMTWKVGQAVGMRCSERGEIIQTLRRSQRRSREEDQP